MNVRFLAVTCIAFGLSWLVSDSVVYRVYGKSMEPLLLDGSYVVVAPATVRTFARNRVVLLLDAWSQPGYAIKRVTGQPGDCVDGATGRRSQERSTECVDLSSDQLFVRGDNTLQSRDSRQLGPVATSAVRGTAIYVVWPPSRFGPIR